MSTVLPPLPEPGPDTREFWDGCRRHELRLQRCAGCARARFAPRPACPWCGSLRFAWFTRQRARAVWSPGRWCTARRCPRSRPLLPYAAGVVELEEGAFMVGQIRGCDPHALRAGLRGARRVRRRRRRRVAAALAGRRDARRRRHRTATPFAAGARTSAPLRSPREAITRRCATRASRLERRRRRRALRPRGGVGVRPPGRACGCARSATTAPYPTRPGSGPALVRLAAMAVSQGLARWSSAITRASRAAGRPLPAEVLADVVQRRRRSRPSRRRGRQDARSWCAPFGVEAASGTRRCASSAPCRRPCRAPSDTSTRGSRAGRPASCRPPPGALFDEANLRPDAVDVACLYAQPAALVPLALQDSRCRAVTAARG